jgi:hypothetical protein
MVFSWRDTSIIPVVKGDIIKWTVSRDNNCLKDAWLKKSGITILFYMRSRLLRETVARSSFFMRIIPRHRQRIRQKYLIAFGANAPKVRRTPRLLRFYGSFINMKSSLNIPKVFKRSRRITFEEYNRIRRRRKKYHIFDQNNLKS